MSVNKFKISQGDLDILKKISNNNNMSENDVVNMIIHLWNECGDIPFWMNETYDFKNEKCIRDKIHNTSFYAEVIGDEHISK